MNSQRVSEQLRKFVAPVMLAALMIFAFAGTAKADEWNKKTILTFSDSVQVPGRVLPAGTYVFKLLDSQSDRHIVQVFDKDERHLITTILAIPDYRMRVTGHTMIAFDERLSTQPQAVKEWFYPGDNFGQEFVYPKDQALIVARSMTTTTTETAANIAPTPAPSEEATPAPTETTPAPEETPAPEATPAPSAEETPEAALPEQEATPAPAQPEQKELPKTGSEIPLILIAGMSALGTAGLVRFRRRRSS